MQRRDFLASGLAVSATLAAGGTMALADTTTSQPREFYELRRYALANGPQTALLEHFLAQALIPALNRLGHTPIGAFRVETGPETPSVYLLIPGASVEALVTTDASLASDQQFLTAAEPFWSAPAAAPAFHRIESSLLTAFSGWPRLTPPPETARKAKRLFQLRTYESPSHRDHIRKVEMFNNGEFEIFRNAGFHQVFYGDTLIGSRLPNLTYLLSAPDQATLDAAWQRFGNDPNWHKLTRDPRYSFEEIVSNITSLILSPFPCSQI